MPYDPLNPSARSGPLGSNLPQEEDRPFFDAWDAISAVPRGVVGAAKGVYNLADTVVGDALPDWRENPLGESKSTLGSLIEGASQFAAGFAVANPLVGAAGRLAGLGATAEAAAATGYKIGKGIAAGALTDFAVWDGHQERLSNLVQSVPSLRNPITEFLAADPNDSEIGGRLKGALEGAGLGLAVESVFLGVKKLRVYSKTVEDLTEQAGGAEKVTTEKAAEIQNRAAIEAEAAVPEQEIKKAHDATLDSAIFEPPSESAAAPSETAVPAKTEAKPAPREDFFASHSADLKHLNLSDDDLTKLQSFMSDPKNIEGAAAELGVDPKKLTGAERLALALPKRSFNLEQMKMGDSTAAWFRMNERLMRDAIDSFHPALVTPETLMETNAKGLAAFADLVGASDSREAAMLAGRNLALDTLQGQKDLAARLTAVRYSMASMADAGAEQMRHALTLRGQGDQFETELLKALQYANLHNQTAASLRGTINEAGRALGSLNLTIEGQKFPGFIEDLAGNPQRLKEILQQEGGVDHVAQQVEKLLAAYGKGGEEGAVKMGKAVQGWMDNPYSKIGGMVQEFWLNSLLSGPRTAAVNGLGPIGFSLYRPLERALGSAIVSTMQGLKGRADLAAMQNPVMKQAIGQFTGLATRFPEVFGTMKELGLDHPDVYDRRAGSSVLESQARRQAIKGANTGFTEGSMAYKAIDAVGNVIRFPTKWLGTTDNAIKLWNFREAARSKLAVEAAEKGLVGDEAAKYVADTMDRLVFDNQTHSPTMLFDRGLSEARAMGLEGDAAKMHAAQFTRDQLAAHPTDGALADFARSEGWESTSTTPAEEGSWSWSLQGLVGRHPIVRFILPFINTPIRIIQATAQRVDPVGPARVLLNTVWDSKWTALNNSRNRFIKEFTSGDPRLQAAAVGRVTAGLSMAATFHSLASSGYITGKGPNDPAQQKVLKDADWLPYAIKTPNGYVSYARLDPLASLIGSAADLANYAAYAPDEDASSVQTAAMGIAVALTNNLTNKTYVQGLANWLDAAREPDKNLQKLANNYAGSLVPSILSQSTGVVGDPTVHDVRGMIDAMTARIPGLSATLPPARNVLGEPIKKPMAVGGEWGDWWLPVAYSSVSDDSIKKELASLGHGFTPMRRTLAGQDLSNVKVGDTTAYDRWGELVGNVTIGGMTLRDAMRKRISAQDYQRASPETAGETVSPRVQMLNSVISKYRAQAYRQLLQESPEVLALDRTLRANQQAAKTGNPLSILPQQ